MSERAENQRVIVARILFPDHEYPARGEFAWSDDEALQYFRELVELYDGMPTGFTVDTATMTEEPKP